MASSDSPSLAVRRRWSVGKGAEIEGGWSLIRRRVSVCIAAARPDEEEQRSRRHVAGQRDEVGLVVPGCCDEADPATADNPPLTIIGSDGPRPAVDGHGQLDHSPDCGPCAEGHQRCAGVGSERSDGDHHGRGRGADCGVGSQRSCAGDANPGGTRSRRSI